MNVGFGWKAHILRRNSRAIHFFRTPAPSNPDYCDEKRHASICDGTLRRFVRWILIHEWRCVVLTGENAEYYARRAREERILAEVATDRRMRAGHQQLAAKFDSLARGYIGMVRESVTG